MNCEEPLDSRRDHTPFPHHPSSGFFSQAKVFLFYISTSPLLLPLLLLFSSSQNSTITLVSPVLKKPPNKAIQISLFSSSKALGLPSLLFRLCQNPSCALQLYSTFSMACICPASPSVLDKASKTVLADDNGKWHPPVLLWMSLRSISPLIYLISLRYNNHWPETPTMSVLSALHSPKSTPTHIEDAGLCSTASIAQNAYGYDPEIHLPKCFHSYKQIVLYTPRATPNIHHLKELSQVYDLICVPFIKYLFLFGVAS